MSIPNFSQIALTISDSSKISMSISITNTPYQYTGYGIEIPSMKLLSSFGFAGKSPLAKLS
jgi:hypothetical protein